MITLIHNEEALRFRTIYTVQQAQAGHYILTRTTPYSETVVDLEDDGGGRLAELLTRLPEPRGMDDTADILYDGDTLEIREGDAFVATRIALGMPNRKDVALWWQEFEGFLKGHKHTAEPSHPGDGVDVRSDINARSATPDV